MEDTDVDMSQDQGQDQERQLKFEALVTVGQVGIIGIVSEAIDHTQYRKMTRTADMLMFARNVGALIKRPRKSDTEAPRRRCVIARDIDQLSDMSLVQKDVETRLHLNLMSISLFQLLALL